MLENIGNAKLSLLFTNFLLKKTKKIKFKNNVKKINKLTNFILKLNLDFFEISFTIEL